MRGERPYQVRVIQKIESWLTIYATSPQEAEKAAQNRPGVVVVMAGTTVLGDRPASNPQQQGEEG